MSCKLETETWQQSCVSFETTDKDEYRDKLLSFADRIRLIREIILTNIVLIGQIPAPTFHEAQRAEFLLDRLAGFHVDECAADNFGNPVGIIRGVSPAKPPIFVAAHLDTHLEKSGDHNFTIAENTVTGPGILDNSAGVGVLASLPEIFRRLNLRFQSDIVLAGVTRSMGKGNLGGIRDLLSNWERPIRGAICLESGGLGRLNYYSHGMIRCEIDCKITADEWGHNFKPNAILVLNEIINEIMEMRMPQRPPSRVIIGKISGGFKHGVIAHDASLGFEIQSTSDDMVQWIFNEIRDIASGYSHEYEVELTLRIISNQKATRLRYNHPLVKSAVAIMEALDIKPVGEPSESELSAFLFQKIPAVTLGITHGYKYQQEDSVIEIEPMFKGIAQVLGVLMAIDSGVCDE